jgi:hypothetical protein
MATNFCVAVLGFAVGMAAPLAWSFFHTPDTRYANAEAGTLKRRILEAKAKGENKVELGILSCGWDIGSLEEALSRDTVVVADLVGKKTYEGKYDLHTLYKFKIKETLLEHPSPNGMHLFQGVPADMLPIGEDEFLIAEANGQMEIDGVTVAQHANGAEYFEGQTYLLFLWIDPLTRTALRSGTNPLGVFLVGSNGNLNSYIDDPYPLKTALAKRFNNSLEDLRRALKK